MKNTPLFIANWKMHKTSKEALSYIDQVLSLSKNHLQHVYLAPSFTLLPFCKKKLSDFGISLGAQNVSGVLEGAFTGEVSAPQLQDVGIDFCLVGHSERRSIYHESNAEIRAKISCLFQYKIMPIFCIGETKQQRDQGKVKESLAKQIIEGLEGFEEKQLSSIVIAYEPVWAIGTGEVATPNIANDTHQMIQEILIRKWGPSMRQVPIIYGGSVKPSNAKELLEQPLIHGVLVGGASLDAESFAKIISEGLSI